jgi:tryptophanyl-tRNA synthetase
MNKTKKNLSSASYKKRILTGDTPTGKLHLGHYVGTLENRVKLQGEYETFIILADLHALTTLSENPKVISEHTRQVAIDNLSVGLDPENVSIFVESRIPEIYELAAIFSMYVSHNRALRNPTIKDEIKMKGLGDKFSLGFVNYPIYQAADILCVKANLVPVGVDQEAHLEQTRELARDINKLAGQDIFPEPKALIGRVGKLMGTDGNPKMGKSLGNVIYLSDSPDEVRRRVMGMYTDPKRIRPTDPGTVEGNPVFVYHDAFNEDKEEVRDLKKRYEEGKVGDVEVKEKLARALNTFLDPIRERRAKYEANPELVEEILDRGSEKVRGEAKKVLEEVKRATGLL